MMGVMGNTQKNSKRRLIAGLLSIFAGLLVVGFATHNAYAAVTNPQSGSIGVEGTIGATPPTQAATIVQPTNGQNFTSTPVTVRGFCPSNVIVKIFSNNIFVGSAACINNSYSLQVDLFSGRNDLVARVFDALDQQGPDSNTVSVTFNDATFAQFGPRVVLSSEYARRGADPGQELSWPVIISGGTTPYAMSIDWGDGSPPDLKSQSFAGVVTFKHSYKASGMYRIIVRATDKNGVTAFLQLVGVANGKVTQSNATNENTTVVTKTQVTWWPTAIGFPLIFASFWLGRRFELAALRRRLEKDFRN